MEMKRPVVITLLTAALALVCLGIVAVIFFTANARFSTNNPFDRQNIPSTLEENKTLEINPDEPILLKVSSEAGSVSVTGADVDTVQVRAVKTAYDSSQARADQEVKGIKYDVEQKGNTITLRYELPQSMNFSNKVNTVDFIVTVPATTTVDVVTGAGEVTVSATKGEVKIVNSFGAVTVQDIEGSLSVGTQSGQVEASSINAGGENIELSSGFGKVSLEKASGRGITLNSSSGVLAMSDVRASGAIEMSTDFGDASFATGSANGLTVKTKSGSVTLRHLNLRGGLTVQDEFGMIELDQVNAGSYDLQANSGSITVDGAEGSVKAHSGFGSVILRNAENATVDLSTQSGSVDFEGSLGEGPHTMHSDFGEIHIVIPADSALNVDLKTEFGTIRSDIPITVTLSGEQNHQTGTMNEGGGQLTVETGSGGISIEARQ
jgi:DUF4097 and DUF4098 domain-containing protein YvlB